MLHHMRGRQLHRAAVGEAMQGNTGAAMALQARSLRQHRIGAFRRCMWTPWMFRHWMIRRTVVRGLITTSVVLAVAASHPIHETVVVANPQKEKGKELVILEDDSAAQICKPEKHVIVDLPEMIQVTFDQEGKNTTLYADRKCSKCGQHFFCYPDDSAPPYQVPGPSSEGPAESESPSPSPSLQQQPQQQALPPKPQQQVPSSTSPPITYSVQHGTMNTASHQMGQQSSQPANPPAVQAQQFQQPPQQSSQQSSQQQMAQPQQQMAQPQQQMAQPQQQMAQPQQLPQQSPQQPQQPMAQPQQSSFGNSPPYPPAGYFNQPPPQQPQHPSGNPPPYPPAGYFNQPQPSYGYSQQSTSTYPQPPSQQQGGSHQTQPNQPNQPNQPAFAYPPVQQPGPGYPAYQQQQQQQPPYPTGFVFPQMGQGYQAYPGYPQPGQAQASKSCKKCGTLSSGQTCYSCGGLLA